MIEITVPLNMPLRRVVLVERDGAPPAWLNQEYARLPSLMASRQTSIEQAAVVTQQQQELELLRQQRAAWARGLTELQRVTAESQAQNAAIISELREAAVELAHVIAAKLVFQQLAAGTFPTDRLVTEVLSRLNTREPTTVQLHPDDLAALKADHPEFGVHDQHVRLVADTKLSRGDCKAVAGEITVVYELHRQLEEIRRELLSTVTGHAEPGS